jgi:two-component system, LytTR family, response regulator
MEKIKTIIVDDNQDSLDIIRFYIEQLPHFTIVDMCQNGIELIDSIAKHNPDLVLLDINMPKLNGVEAIRACLKIKNDISFVFITSYDEYAVEAFELSATDYIVKPIEKTRLYSALERVASLLRSRNNQGNNPLKRLIIKDGHDYYYIPLMDIIFIEKVGKKCHIYTKDKIFNSGDNIGDIINQLPKDTFFLSHRSYIININKLSHILAKNQTYLAYFMNTDKYAHISKLKIDELQNRIKSPS